MDRSIPEGMSTQAQQIWSMLDDMAQNDPAAYRKFIEKQMKEGKEQMAPPDPHMCVQVSLLNVKAAKPLFINFMSWKRVPEPKTPEDAVPVSGSPITHEIDESAGEYALTAVVFNPKVLDKFGRDCQNQADADTLIQLALDYVEHEQKVKVSRSYTVLPKCTPLKGDLELVRLCFSQAFHSKGNNTAASGGLAAGDSAFERDVSEMEKTFGPLSSNERESLLSQLSNISVSSNSDNKNSSSSQGTQSLRAFGSSSVGSDKDKNDVDPNIRITGLSGNGTNKGGLIQELSEDKVSSAPPKYTLVNSVGTQGKQLVLKVELPHVKSVAECELDISEDDVKLVVADQHDWKIKLPSRIDRDAAKAKFSKKLSVLTLTMPLSLKS